MMSPRITRPRSRLPWLLPACLPAVLALAACQALDDPPDDDASSADFSGSSGFAGSSAVGSMMSAPATFPRPEPSSNPFGSPMVMAPPPPAIAPPIPPPPQCIDLDGDSYGTHCVLGEDCDDTDRFRGPSCERCEDLTNCARPHGALGNCVLDGIARAPVQPLTDPRPRIEDHVVGSGECALTLPVEDDGLLPETGTLEVLYQDYCSGDLLDWDALHFDVALPEHTAITFEVCGTDGTFEDCEWQQVAHIAAGETCSVDADCRIGERCDDNPSGGICSALTTAACEADADCADTGLCQAGHCASFRQPVELGRFLLNAFRQHWALRVTLHADPERAFAPTLHDVYLTYNCNQSI